MSKPVRYRKGEHRKRDKLLIVGFAPSYKRAPFSDESFEVWGLNELYAHIPRWDRWFDLHLLERIKAHSRDGKRLQSLAAMTCPVYMVRHYAEVPNSIPYPLKAMTREFFGVDEPKQGYWTNSISYMLALAIHEGYPEIHVYGVDMAADSEYHYQRPSCEYFLGVARGRGIKIHLPVTADLLKAQWLYGYDEPEQERWRAKMKEKLDYWQGQHQAAVARRDEAHSAAEQFSGAVQAAQDVIKIFGV